MKEEKWKILEERRNERKLEEKEENEENDEEKTPRKRWKSDRYKTRSHC